MAKRYEILGVAELAQTLGNRRQRMDKFYFGPGKYPSDKNQLIIRKDDVGICLELACYRHLQFDLPGIDIVRYLNEGCDTCIDYFYGDYLKQPNVAAMMQRSPDGRLSWFEMFRNGLFLSLLANNKATEKQLVDWIEPWLPFDESSYLVTAHDNNYHKLLAEFIKHGKLTSEKLVAELKNCKKQRPKLLFASLNAIIDRDNKALSANFKKLLNEYLKSEFNKRVASQFALEGSILWHIAQRNGLKPEELDEKQNALIMTRETLGLAA